MTEDKINYGWVVECPYLKKSKVIGATCSITDYQVKLIACAWCQNPKRKVDFTEVI